MMMMIGISLCKAISHVRCGYKSCFLQNPSILSLKYVSTTANQHSFTVSYLINTFGFSPESALSVSKRVHFETPDKPDSVVNFFNNHGFSKSQISMLARKYPQLVACTDPEKILLPKIEFFYSKGISSIDLAKSLSVYPGVLTYSLKDRIIPCFDYLKGLLRSDDKVIMAIKRFADILTRDPQSYIEPNIATLQQYGVPESNIMCLLSRQPRAFVTKPDEFKKVVEEVKGMGINPSRMCFVTAIHAKRSMTKSTWEKKLDVYRRCGWSEEEVSLAFKNYPRCMTYSENKIMAVMDTFVNKLGWESSLVARRPLLLSLSLRKRIAPRSSVIQLLLSKGLIDRSIALHKLFESSEELFLQKFVTCYEEKLPHLLKLYQEKIDLSNNGIRTGPMVE